MMQPGTKLHTRTYDIDAFVVDDGHFRLDGRVKDVKPDGLWGTDDETPMAVHDMTLSMTVDVSTLIITEVSVAMHTHPQHECPLVLNAYQQLVGLSIMRGFTHKVRELFGGPRACTHIGALINAMAPVAMQTIWAFSHALPTGEVEGAVDSEAQAAARRRGLERNRDTCHVWATDGPMFSRIEAGVVFSHTPLWAIERLNQLGIDVEEWERRHH